MKVSVLFVHFRGVSFRGVNKGDLGDLADNEGYAKNKPNLPTINGKANIILMRFCVNFWMDA